MKRGRTAKQLSISCQAYAAAEGKIPRTFSSSPKFAHLYLLSLLVCWLSHSREGGLVLKALRCQVTHSLLQSTTVIPPSHRKQYPLYVTFKTSPSCLWELLYILPALYVPHTAHLSCFVWCWRICYEHCDSTRNGQVRGYFCRYFPFTNRVTITLAPDILH